VYLPSAFQENDLETIRAFVRRHDFGILLTQGAGGWGVTHLPLLLEGRPDGGDALRGHVARANPHWREFESGREALVVFQGPHGYVSPTWYASQANVPTWNYATVHAYGSPRILEDPAETRRLLEDLTLRYEGAESDSWRLSDLPEEYLDRMTRAIVGFEMPVSRWEAKFKLSQNRSEEDRRRVAEGLRNGDRLSVLLAELMTEPL
jgi:transcriptional regulator